MRLSQVPDWEGFLRDVPTRGLMTEVSEWRHSPHRPPAPAEKGDIPNYRLLQQLSATLLLETPIERASR
jgi:hypothetical protein